MNLAGWGGTSIAGTIAGILIVIGLLLALRVVARKFRKRRTWAMINAEREDNKRHYERSAASFAAVAQQLETNHALLEPLRTRTGGLPSGLAGQVAWTGDFPALSNSAWQTVTQQGLTALMQPHELREVQELYTDQDVLQASLANIRHAIDAGNRHAQGGISASGSQWLVEEIELLEAIRTAHAQLGADLRHFHQQHTDFVPVV